MHHRGGRDARGKLKAVARAWAGGRGGVIQKADDIVTQSATLPDWLVNRPAEVTEIPADDAPVVSLFIALATQWRRHPMTGQRLGLDYPAIRPTAEIMDVTVSPAMLNDLRIMEDAALAEFARSAR